jgi:hypothetical protein
MLVSTYEYKQKLAVIDDRLASVLQRARTSKNIPPGTRTIDCISQLTFQSLVVYTTCCNIYDSAFCRKVCLCIVYDSHTGSDFFP